MFKKFQYVERQAQLVESHYSKKCMYKIEIRNVVFTTKKFVIKILVVVLREQISRQPRLVSHEQAINHIRQPR